MFCDRNSPALTKSNKAAIAGHSVPSSERKVRALPAPETKAEPSTTAPTRMLRCVLLDGEDPRPKLAAGDGHEVKPFVLPSAVMVLLIQLPGTDSAQYGRNRTKDDLDVRQHVPLPNVRRIQLCPLGIVDCTPSGDLPQS
jgi:hypothetical protein